MFGLKKIYGGFLYENGAFVVDSLECPRCKRVHEEIALLPLTNPPTSEGFSVSHFGICPILKEPIFSSIDPETFENRKDKEE